jgi:surface protein
MFYIASSFNQYIGDWDTSSAISISWMFARNPKFNQDISTKQVPLLKEDGTIDTNEDGTAKTRTAWDVSNVKHASLVFYNAMPEDTAPIDFDIRSWNLVNTQLLNNQANSYFHVDLEDYGSNGFLNNPDWWKNFGRNLEDLDPINGAGPGAGPMSFDDARSGNVRDLPSHQIKHSAYKLDSIDCILVDKNIVYGEDETTRSVELAMDIFKQDGLGSATSAAFYSKELPDILTPANDVPSTGRLELSNIEFLELTETEKSLFNGQKAYKLNGTTTLENVSVLYTIWFSLPEQDNGESKIIYQMTFPEYVKEDGTVATNGPYTNTLVYKLQYLGEVAEREAIIKNHKDQVITSSTSQFSSKPFVYNKDTKKYEVDTTIVDVEITAEITNTEPFGGLSATDLPDGALKMIKQPVDEVWAGSTLTQTNFLPFSANDSKIITIDVSTNVPGTFLCKLEDPDNSDNYTELEATHNGTGKETLTYDFTLTSLTYTKLVFFPWFNTTVNNDSIATVSNIKRTVQQDVSGEIVSKNIALRVINPDFVNKTVVDGLYLESDSAIANPKPDGLDNGLNNLKSLDSSQHVALSNEILNLPMTNTTTLRDVIGNYYINMETGENKSTILYNTVFVQEETTLNLYDAKDGAVYNQQENTFMIPSNAGNDAKFVHSEGTDVFGNPINPIYPLTFTKGQGNIVFDYEVPLTEDGVPVRVDISFALNQPEGTEKIKFYSEIIGTSTQTGEATISLLDNLPTHNVEEISMTLTTKDVAVKLSNVRIQDDKYFDDATETYFMVNVETVPVEEEKSKYVISTPVNMVRDIRDVEDYYLNKEMKFVPNHLEGTTFLWNYRKDGVAYMVTRQPQVDEDGNELSVVVKELQEGKEYGQLVLKSVSEVDKYSVSELCSTEGGIDSADVPFWKKLNSYTNINMLTYALGWFDHDGKTPQRSPFEGNKYYDGYMISTNDNAYTLGLTQQQMCNEIWAMIRYQANYGSSEWTREQELYETYNDIILTDYLNHFAYVGNGLLGLQKSNGLIGDIVLKNQYTTVEQASLSTETASYIATPYNNTLRERGVLNYWKLGELTDLNGLFAGRTDFNEDLSKWDVSKVTDMSNLFNGCTNFDGDISNWDVSSVEDMSGLFESAENFNGDISKWNTSSVTDMSGMFYGAFKFNRDISTKVVDEGLETQYNAWDVSSVQTMANMLNMSIATLWNGADVDQFSHGKGDFNNGEEAGLSNKPLLWDTKSCTDMSYLFRQSRRFNQNVSTKDVTVGGKTYTSFNTSSVTTMRRTFAYCEYFNNGDLPGESSKPLLWNTELVTNLEYMVGIYQNFVLPYSIREKTPIFNWEKEELELYLTDPDEWARVYGEDGLYTTPYESADFQVSGSYNQPYNNGTRVEFGEGENKIAYTPFDLSRCLTVKLMHLRQAMFNQPITLSLGSCTDLDWFLSTCRSFNNRIEITTGENANARGVLENCISFNQQVDGIDTSNMTNIGAFFIDCEKFNQPIDSFDTRNVTTVDNMFYGCSKFNQSIDSLDLTNVRYMFYMLYNATSFNQPINLDTKNVEDFVYFLSGATSFNQPLTLDLRSARFVYGLLEGATSFNQELVSELVTEDREVTEVDENGNETTTTVTDIVKNVMSLPTTASNVSTMLKDCTSFNKSLDKFDFTNVTNMTSFLEGATSFNQNIKDINVGNVTNMTAMLKGCTSFNQCFEGIDTSSVTTMESLLEGATSFNECIEKITTTNVTNMKNMLKGASSYNMPVTKLDLTNVTTLEGFLEDAVSYNKLLVFSDTDKLNTTAVTTMKNMLKGAVNFDRDVVGLATDNVTTMESMLEGATSFNKSIVGLPSTSTTNVKHMLKGATSYNKSLEGLDTSNLEKVEGLLEGATSFNQPLKLTFPAAVKLDRLLKGATAFNSELSDLSIKTPPVGVPKTIKTDPSIIIDQLNTGFYAEYGFTDLDGVFRANGANVTDEQGAANEFNSCNSRLLISGKANDRITCTISYRAEQDFDYVYVDLHKVNGLNSDKQIDVNTIIESTTSILEVTSDQLPAILKSLDIDQTPDYDYILEVRFRKDSVWDAYGSGAGGDLVEVSDIKLNGVVNSDPDTFISYGIDNLLEGASSFNQPLQQLDTSSITSMKGLLKDASSFNQELGYLNVSNVTDMSNMFENATAFTGAGERLHADKNIRYWTVKEDCLFTDMFKGATKFQENFFPTAPGYELDSNTPLGLFFNQDRPCFDASTKILTIKDGKEEYVPICLLKEGDIVQTYKHGPKPIKYIGTTRITLNGLGDDYTLKMYRMKKTGGMIDDLLVTGRHSMLVDDWSNHYCENRRSEVSTGKIDDKYVLGAAYSNLFKEEKQKKIYNIYHLEIDGENQRYGIYANGVLAETLQKGSEDKLIKNKSSMKLPNVEVVSRNNANKKHAEP